MKKLFSIGIFFLFMLSTVTLSSAIKIDKLENSNEEKMHFQLSNYDNISFDIITDKNEYKKGEQVHISLQITNYGSENITIGFPDAKTHDFIIFSFFWYKRYRWSDGKNFVQVPTLIKIPAGETHYWNKTWNQKAPLFRFMPLIFHRQCRSGIYYIVGYLNRLVGYEDYITYKSIFIG